jgi:NAD(P)-dependent dehydrogenase (short-subunit alcohol dehydrogenase family)
LALTRTPPLTKNIPCNVGINVFHEPLETTEAEWRRRFSVDLEGAWHMRKATLPAILEAGAGSLTNITSSHSSTVIPDTFPSPVAKHRLPGQDQRC